MPRLRPLQYPQRIEARYRRLLHGYALSFTEQFGFGRFWGTTLTYAVLGVEALMCLYQAVMPAG